jgi:ATP-binding cassette, subfamily B (MDR/TAP), member 1
LFNFTATRITRRIRLKYLRKILHKPISYFDTNAPGTIATSLSNDTTIVQIGLSEKLSIVCQSLSLMICAFVIGFSRNWKLSFATLATIFWSVLSAIIFGGRKAQADSKASVTLGKASGVAEEALSSIQNVTAMAAADKIVQKYAEIIKEAMRQWAPVGPWMALIYGNSEFVHSLFLKIILTFT